MSQIDIGAVIGRARWVRERCGFIGQAPPYSTRKVMETCFPDVAVTGSKDVPRGCVELTQVTASGQRVIFYKRGLPHPVQRVGVLHGLHHLLSDLKAVPGMAECNTQLRWLERAANLTTDPVEVACDLFAADVLMPWDVLGGMAPAVLFPRDKIKEHLFLDECDSLASRFSVPLGFLKWRLYDLIHLRKTHYFPR